jgi:hypothetical protein
VFAAIAADIHHRQKVKQQSQQRDAARIRNGFHRTSPKLFGFPYNLPFDVG